MGLLGLRLVLAALAALLGRLITARGLGLLLGRGLLTLLAGFLAAALFAGLLLVASLLAALLALVLVDQGVAAATASVAAIVEPSISKHHTQPSNDSQNSRPVIVDGHEGRGAAVGAGALAAQTGDLVVLVHLVVFQNSKLDLKHRSVKRVLVSVSEN